MPVRIPHSPLILLCLSVALTGPAGAQPKHREAATLGSALASGEAGNWDRAEVIADGIGHRVTSDIVTWARLRDGEGSWDEYTDFLERNAHWPGLATLRRAGEFRMPANLPPEQVRAYFAGNPPQTGTGSIRLADALERSGDDAAAKTEVIRAWRKTSMTAPERTAIRRRWSETVARHHEERLDMLLWRGLTREAEAMLSLVDADWQALAKARIATRRDAAGLQQLIWNVPEYLRDDPGLAFERYLYRTEKGRWDDAEDFILENSGSAATLGRPDMWMKRRANLARQALRNGDTEKAYAIAAQNFGGTGWPYADSEWVAGFIALTQLGDAQKAIPHFERFREAVATPISLGRAGYWLGLAQEAAGDIEAAREAYALGAQHQTSFYGQLAAERAGLPMDESIATADTLTDWENAGFVQSDVLQAARILYRAGYETRALQFLRHLAEDKPAETRAAIAQMAIDTFSPHFGVRIAKDAARAGIIIPAQYYPLHEIAEGDWPVPPELALAIARQESELNPTAKSPAGALGLMQLMPRTAAQVAAGLSLAYSPGRLTRDHMYNARLGTEYLRRMLDRYDGSIILAAAAYNAGPGRADQWIRTYGDPRKPSIDPVIWIESIPFTETRNYVQRVIEGVDVYRIRLAGKVQSPRPPSGLLRSEWLSSRSPVPILQKTDTSETAPPRRD